MFTGSNLDLKWLNEVFHLLDMNANVNNDLLCALQLHQVALCTGTIKLSAMSSLFVCSCSGEYECGGRLLVDETRYDQRLFVATTDPGCRAEKTGG